MKFVHPDECPDGPHRGPEGPCEDLGQCGKCLSPSWRLRPKGERFGDHIPDCSLPDPHPGFCMGGGWGHPPTEVMRG